MKRAGKTNDSVEVSVPLESSQVDEMMCRNALTQFRMDSRTSVQKGIHTCGICGLTHNVTGTVAMVTVALVAAHQSVASLLKCVFQTNAHTVQRQLFSPLGVLEINNFTPGRQRSRGKERTLQGQMFKSGKMISIHLHSQLEEAGVQPR